MKTTILYKGHYRETGELMRELASLVMESSDQAHEDTKAYIRARLIAHGARGEARITQAHARKTQAWATLAYAQSQWRQALKQLGLGC